MLESPPPPPKIKIKGTSFFAHSKHNFPPSTTSNSTNPSEQHLNDSPTVKRLEKYFTDDISQLFTSMTNLTTPTSIKNGLPHDNKNLTPIANNIIDNQDPQIPISQSQPSNCVSPPTTFRPMSPFASPSKSSSTVAACSTPNSKRKSTNNRSSPSDTPKKTKKNVSFATDITKDPAFDPTLKLKLMDLSDDMLQTTPSKHLAQILALRVRTNDKLAHFKKLLQLTDDQIRTKASSVRDTLRKRPIKTILAATRDSSINGLSIEALRATFKNIQKQMNNPITESTLSNMSPEDLVTSIIAHRDSLKPPINDIKTSQAPPINPTTAKSSNSNTNMIDNTTTSNDTTANKDIMPAITNETKISHSTTNDDIISMTTDELRSAYRFIRAKSFDPISEAGLALYTQQELNDLVTNYRDTLKEINKEVEDALSESPKDEHSSSSTPQDPNTSNTKDTDNNSSNNENQSKSTNTSTSTSPSSEAKIDEMHNLSIRPKVFKTRIEGSFPELARTFFAKIREWDNDVSIIPFSNSAQNVLSHESNIPDDMEQASAWIRNTIDNDKWKYFSFQIRTTKTRDYIRGKMFRWMSEVKCYTKVDLISSDKIACLGFFTNLHPEFHNRDRIMCHIHEYLTNELNQKTYVSIYTRPIHAGKGNDRTETHAVVIEAAQAEAAAIGDKLYKLPLHDYTDVMFVPFTKFDKKFPSTLKTVIKANKKFALNIEELTIPTLRFCTSFLKFRGDIKTLREVILSYNTPECSFIHDVDVDRKGGTIVMYHIPLEDKCKHFLEQLPTLLHDNLTTESLEACLQGNINIDKILSPTKAKMARATIRHSNAVREKYSPSTQKASTTVENAPTSQVTYATAVSGSTTSSTTISSMEAPKLPDNIKSMIDEAVQTKLNQTHPPSNDDTTSPILPDNILSLIDAAVEKKLDNMSQSHITAADVETLINTAVTDKISPYATRITTLEELPVPDIPSHESITTTIKTEVQKELKSISSRVSTIENSLGAHTEQTNTRLHSLEETLRKQTESIDKFMAAMTAPTNNHIPAINSTCRVGAKVI